MWAIVCLRHVYNGVYSTAAFGVFAARRTIGQSVGSDGRFTRARRSYSHVRARLRRRRRRQTGQCYSSLGKLSGRPIDSRSVRLVGSHRIRIAGRDAADLPTTFGRTHRVRRRRPEHRAALLTSSSFAVAFHRHIYPPTCEMLHLPRLPPPPSPQGSCREW